MKTNAQSILLLVLFPVFAFVPRLAAESAGTDEDVITLPKYEVVDKLELPTPESWLYGKIDGFEVLTNARAAETNSLLQEFQKFRHALHIARPATDTLKVSASLILCKRSNSFTQFTADGKSAPEGVASFLLRDSVRAAIVLDLETQGLDLDDASLEMAAGKGANGSAAAVQDPNSDSGPSGTGAYGRLAVEHNRQLYRQYFRLVLTQNGQTFPPWLLEGITQMAMDIKFDSLGFQYGRLPLQQNQYDFDGDPAGSNGHFFNASAQHGPPAARNRMNEDDTWIGDRCFVYVLARQRLMPLDEFFGMPADSPAALNPLANGLWAKQAYAFVHLCQFGKAKNRVEPFKKFLNRLGKEPLSEPLFKECFGLSYEGMLNELDRYIEYPLHTYRTVKYAKGGEPVTADVAFREATQSEIAVIKGDAQRMAGRRNDAYIGYRVAYARGERTPDLLAALGEEEFFLKNTARAKKFLEVAVKLGTNRPAALTALASLRLDATSPGATNAAKLTPAQAAPILRLLIKAQALDPSSRETYRLMAATWERVEATPTPANIHLIGKGVMLFPADAELALTTAGLYTRAGDIKNAREVARMGLRFTTDPATRTRFEEFLSKLPENSPAENKAPLPSR